MTIIVHLKGGLGNQLFQYATAKALARHHNASLILDDSWYHSTPKDLTPRHLLLSSLKIPEESCTYRKFLPKNSLLQKLALFFPRPKELILHNNDPFFFDDSLFDRALSPNKNYFLIGYWQSFKYFERIRTELQKILKPRSQISQHYSLYLKEIQNATSVMIHIRRGDYVTLKSANTLNGVLDLDYYLKSMKKILEWQPKAHFFVFSDDIEWAMKNLPKEYCLTFIHNEPHHDSVINELFLMTQCKHHIIANSSLSWWGAWLSDADKGQKVISPNRWINKAEINLSNLLPQSWLKIAP